MEVSSTIYNAAIGSVIAWIAENVRFDDLQAHCRYIFSRDDDTTLFVATVTDVDCEQVHARVLIKMTADALPLLQISGLPEENIPAGHDVCLVELDPDNQPIAALMYCPVSRGSA